MPATDVTTTPYWSRSASFPSVEPLTQNASADVVVGGGMTGLKACPCHGSRFGTDAHVISGPAATPLAPVD